MSTIFKVLITVLLSQLLTFYDHKTFTYTEVNKQTNTARPTTVCRFLLGSRWTAVS